MENVTQLDIRDGTSQHDWLVNRTHLELNNEYITTWIDLLLTIAFSTLIVVTIVGNTLVIAAVITTRRLRSVTNCFVSSLAAADLLVGLAVMPPAVMLQLNGGTWELGEALCDSWVSLDILLCTASILSLCAISIDRYLAVTQPLIYSRRRRSKRLAGLMIVVVWVLAGAITSPPLLGCFPRPRNLVETEKRCSYNTDSSYVVFSAMGSFFLPMSVMLYVYGRISCVIAKRHRNLETSDSPASDLYRNQPGGATGKQLKSPEPANGPRMHRRSTRRHFHTAPERGSTIRESSLAPTTATTTGTRLTVPGSVQQQDATTSSASSPTGQPRRSIVRVGTMKLGGSSNQQQHCCSVNRVTRETKTAGTLAAVVGGFVACWLPFFILYLATPFMPVEPPGPLMPALTWLGWMNSAMNPFIYAFYSADFRLAFWRLTCRHCWRSRFDSMNAAGPGGAAYGAGFSAGGPTGPNSQAAINWRRQTSRA